MKQSEIEETNAFDENIKNSIEAYEAPMAENSWNQFLDYFQNYTKLRRKLYISKSIEACLILLAIFTFWNMQPQIKKGIEKMDMVFNRYHHHSIEEEGNNQSIANNEFAQEYSNSLKEVKIESKGKAEGEVEPNSISELKSDIDVLTNNDLVISKSNEIAVNNNAINNVEAFDNADVIGNTAQVNLATNKSSSSNPNLDNPNSPTSFQNTESVYNENETETNVEYNSNLPIPFIKSENSSNKNQTLSEETLPLKTLIPNLKSIQKEENKSFTQVDHRNLNAKKYELKGDFVEERKIDRPINAFASIDGRPLKALDYNLLESTFNFSPPKLKHKTNLYLSTQASMDVNYVFTPFDKVYNTNPYLQAAVGYSAGLNIAFEKGRWALETGAHYSTKTYSPIDIEEVVGSFKQGFYGVSLKDIEIETINIPIMARYKLVHLRNWKMYGMFGGSINMAILANYFKKNTDYSAVASTASLVPLTNANIEDKNFSDGLFEGGDIFENIYFTANAAINIERKISNRLSIYVQPGMQYNLLNTGLGPNNDRIHTASLAVGTRVQLR